MLRSPVMRRWAGLFFLGICGPGLLGCSDDAAPAATVDATSEVGVDAGTDVGKDTAKDDVAGDGTKPDATGDVPAEVPAEVAAEVGADATDASDAFDSAVPFDTAGLLDAGGDALPTGTNYCRETGATATASSTYSGYDAPRVNDGDLGTSWFSATGTCTGAGTPVTCPTDAAVISVALAGDRNVGRVYIFANREFATGYSMVSGHLEVKTAGGTVAFSKSFTLPTAGTDLGISVSPAVSNARTIRLVIDSADGDGPGVAEIAAYAP